MGRLLDELIQGTPACEVKSEPDGFTLAADYPDRLDEFSDLVREAVDQAGEEFMVFPTSDGGHRYSRMFVIPMPTHRVLVDALPNCGSLTFFQQRIGERSDQAGGNLRARLDGR